MSKPTIDRLREAFAYDPASGVIVRKVAGGGRKAGRVVGCVQPNGYVTARLDGCLLYCHHIAWALTFGAWPKLIDHIDGNPLDNRLANLREVSQKVNAQNRRKANNSTGHLGVARSGCKFFASIRYDGRNVYLGTFDTAEQAHDAYLDAKRAHHEGNTL